LWSCGGLPPGSTPVSPDHPVICYGGLTVRSRVMNAYVSRGSSLAQCCIAIGKFDTFET
jgi:hypothetical protein